jgi:indole-3-glycerol phosphate synthase
MILDKIVEDKKKRLIFHKGFIDETTMKEMALHSPRKSVSFYNSLVKKELSIIGEFKKASPSMGVINNKIALEDRINQYNQSVDAISCLTEEDHFHGSADYLKKIRAISDLPIIRKDFIIDEYQIYEAKVIGADAILLIAAILTDDDMKRFYELAYELGMDVLLEVHNKEEMLRGIYLGAKIIGINNRNLKDFTIDLETTRKLVAFLYEHKTEKQPILVSESGIAKKEDIEFLKRCKVHGILIGTALMEVENPGNLAKEWKEVFNEVGGR